MASDENWVCYSVGIISIVDTWQDDARVNALEERASNGEQTAFNELIQVLSSDASKYARQAAAHSLGRLHDTRAIEPLVIAMLNDEYSGVRMVAAEKLEHFGDPRAIGSLRKACRDPDPGVREVAEKALERLSVNS